MDDISSQQEPFVPFKHIASLFLIGSLSGIVSFMAFKATPVPDFLPGTIFGVAIALYFFIFQKVYSWKNILLFIIISTLSWFAAIYIAVRTLWAYILWGMTVPLGATVGSILMLCGFHYLISRLTSRQMFMLTVLGGTLSYIAISGSDPWI